MLNGLIIRLTGGRTSEIPEIKALLSIGFFMGIFVATYDVTVSTLFLDLFDEKNDLPWAFTATGLLGVLATIVYRVVQQKAGFKPLAVYSTLISLILITIVAIGINFYNSKELIFFGFILTGPTTIVVILIFWGIFGRIFNVRAAKRLSGGIDTGQALSTILAFFAIPVIQIFVKEVPTLLYISVVAIAGVFFSVVYIFRTFKLLNATSIGNLVKTRSSEKQVVKEDEFQKKYIQLISIFVICSALAAAFVDYSFKTVAPQRFTDQGSLATFLSFFEGTVMIVAFLVQTFLNDKILEYYGLKNALLFLPGALIVFGVISTVVGLTLGYTAESSTFLFFFLLIAISKLITASLRDSLENPTVKIFFFPIHPELRFDLQARVEGTVQQMASLAGGLGMLLLVNVGSDFYNIIYNNYVLFGIIVVWMMITTNMYQYYRIALTNSLKAFGKSTGAIERKNAKHNILNHLAKEIENRDEALVKFIIRFVERIDLIFYRNVLMSFPDYRNASNQLFAIRRIGNDLLFNAFRTLRTFLRRADNTIITSMTEGIRDHLKRFKSLSKDFANFESLSKSSDPKDRWQAVRMMELMDSGDVLRNIIPFFRDLDAKVRNEAIYIAGHKKLETLIPILIEHLSITRFSNAAFSSLVNIGNPVLAPLESAFYKNGQTKDTRLLIVQVYGRLGGDYSIDLLLNKIDFPEKSVVQEVFKALNQSGYYSSGDARLSIKNACITQAGVLCWNMAATLEVKKDMLNKPLLAALEEEIEQNYIDLFVLLGLLYDRENIALVRTNMEQGTADSVGYAIELLDVLVEDDIKTKIIPLLDDSSVADRVKKLAIQFPKEPHDEVQILIEIINRDYNYVGVYTKACALYALALRDGATVTDDMLANLFNPNRLLREIAGWAVHMLSPETYFSILSRLPEHQVQELNKTLIKNPNQSYQPDLIFDRIRLFREVDLFHGISGDLLLGIVKDADSIKTQGDAIVPDEFLIMESFDLFVVKNGKAFIEADGLQSQSYSRGDLITPMLFNPDDRPIEDFRFTFLDNCELFQIDATNFYLLAAHSELISTKIIYNLKEKLGVGLSTEHIFATHE